LGASAALLGLAADGFLGEGQDLVQGFGFDEFTSLGAGLGAGALIAQFAALGTFDGTVDSLGHGNSVFLYILYGTTVFWLGEGALI
jgi:hypothetical protein